eukprot:6315828-Prymnesium_polylepis.1
MSTRWSGDTRMPVLMGRRPSCATVVSINFKKSKHAAPAPTIRHTLSPQVYSLVRQPEHEFGPILK